MKIVVLERDAYGDGSHRFYLGLLQMAGDLGYRIRLCRPHQARTNGKVERFNRYLRESSLKAVAQRGLLIFGRFRLKSEFFDRNPRSMRSGRCRTSAQGDTHIVN